MAANPAQEFPGGIAILREPGPVPGEKERCRIDRYPATACYPSILTERMMSATSCEYGDGFRNAKI